MASPSTSSLEKLLLPQADTQDLKKSSLTVLYENRRCVLFCILVYMCSFFQGYEQSVSGSLIAFNAFIDKFGIDFHGQKTISLSFQQGIRVWTTTGSIVSNCVQWWLSERYVGRIRLAQCGLAIGILSTVIQILAPTRTWWCAGKFFMGVSDAAVRYGVFLWAGESAVPKLRGCSSALWGIKISVGGLLGLFVIRAFQHHTGPMAYRVPMIIGLGPQCLAVLLLFVVPESPRHLVMLGRIDAARATLQRLRSGAHCTPEAIESEIVAIQAGLELERKSDKSLRSAQSTFGGRCGLGSWWTAFKNSHIYAAFLGNHKKRLLVCAVAGTFYVASGFEFAITSQSYLLRAMGEPDPFKYSIITGAASIAGSLFQFGYCAENIGRRKSLLLGLVLSICGMLAIGITFVAPGGVSNLVQRRVLSYVTTAICFSNFSLVIIIAHVIAHEIPAQEYRSVAAAAHWITFFVTITLQDVIQPYWINVTKLNLKGKIAFLYVGTGLVATIFIYFFVSESRGVALEELNLLYTADVSPRKSAQWIREHRQRVLAGKIKTNESVVAVEKSGAMPSPGDSDEKLAPGNANTDAEASADSKANTDANANANASASADASAHRERDPESLPALPSLPKIAE